MASSSLSSHPFSLTGTSSLQGIPLLTAITSVCSAGFLLFGYDQGVMSGIVISNPWLATMGNPSTLLVGTITALYDIGAFLGALFAAFAAEPLGRKRSLILGATVLTVGSIIMGTSYERAQFMVGRVVTGVGIGVMTSVCPVYQSEVSSAGTRGWLVCCQLTTMLVGLMLAYWINYGMYWHLGDVQWRFPLLFQCLFSAFILVVTPWLPDTPRWLIRKDEEAERGLAVLARLRGTSADDKEVQKEKDDIVEAIGVEVEEEGGWLDLFKGHGIKSNKRFYLAVGIQFMQQMSGELTRRFPWDGGSLTVCIRHQYRDLLCPNPIPNEPRYGSGDGTVPWLLYAAMVCHCVVPHGKLPHTFTL
jgi:MFS family permease